MVTKTPDELPAPRTSSTGALRRNRSDAIRSIRDQLPDLAHDATGAATSAAVGLAMAGPTGVLVAAVTGAVAQGVLELSKVALRSRLNRMRKTYEAAGKMLPGESASLEDLLFQDDGRIELAVRALEAAASRAFGDRIGAFAAAIADIALAKDSKDLARVGLVIRALNELDDIHLVVLTATVDHIDDGGLTPSDLERLLHIPATELRPVVRMLELHGLIVDEGRFGNATESVLWKASELGVLCVKLVRDNPI